MATMGLDFMRSDSDKSACVHFLCTIAEILDLQGEKKMVCKEW